MSQMLSGKPIPSKLPNVGTTILKVLCTQFVDRMLLFRPAQ